MFETVRNALKAFRNNPLNNPSVSLSSPGAWWWLSGFNRMSAAGTRVDNEHTALEVPAVNACVRVISNSIASLPIRLYKEDSGNPARRIEAREHPVARLMRWPNDDMTSVTMMSAIGTQMALFGSAFVEIIRDQNGVPDQLYPRLPWLVQIKRDGAGILFFELQDDEGPEKRRRIDAENMIYIPGLISFDGIISPRVIHTSREIIGLSMAQDLMAAAWYRNTGNTSLVLKTDKLLKPEQKSELRHEWEALQSGQENRFRLAVLDQNLQLDSISVNAVDADMVNAQRLATERVAGVFGVPLYLLSVKESTSRSSIEQISLDWLKFGLMPWLRRIEEAFEHKLSPTAAYTFRFDVSELLRTDMLSRYNAFNIARQAGFLSVNEIRAQLGLNPIDGGDEYLQPLNMTPVGKGGDQDAIADELEDAEAN